MFGRLAVWRRVPSRPCECPGRVFDGTDPVTLVWIGRRRIPGIEPGKTLMVRGRVGDRDGQKVIFNPYYELRGDS